MAGGFAFSSENSTRNSYPNMPTTIPMEKHRKEHVKNFHRHVLADLGVSVLLSGCVTVMFMSVDSVVAYLSGTLEWKLIGVASYIILVGEGRAGIM